MGRNFHSAKDYEWKETPGGLLSASDPHTGQVLFVVYVDGPCDRDALINVFFSGLDKGKRDGRESISHELRTLIGAEAVKKR